MQKIVFLVGFLLCFLSGFAQETLQSYPTKKIAFSKDTISIEKFSLNNSFFEIKEKPIWVKYRGSSEYAATIC